jgi:hypothetical protein
MEYAILRTVLLMLCCSFLEAKQYLRFRPRSCLVPEGSLSVPQRLWKVRLDGCWYRVEGGSFIALLKLVWIDLFGFEQKPKLVRQRFLVMCRRWAILVSAVLLV